MCGLAVSTVWITKPASPLMFAGNADTLKHEPKMNNIDTYTRLREFWQRHYSAHYMTLVVQSKGNITCSLKTASLLLLVLLEPVQL